MSEPHACPDCGRTDTHYPKRRLDHGWIAPAPPLNDLWSRLWDDLRHNASGKPTGEAIISKHRAAIEQQAVADYLATHPLLVDLSAPETQKELAEALSFREDDLTWTAHKWDSKGNSIALRPAGLAAEALAAWRSLRDQGQRVNGVRGPLKERGPLHPRVPKPDYVAALLFQLKAVRDLVDTYAVREHRFHENRKWRFDLAFVPQKVAVEVDGGAYVAGRHVRGAGFEADCEKQSEAAALGWRVLHVTPRQVESGQALGWLERALA